MRLVSALKCGLAYSCPEPPTSLFPLSLPHKRGELIDMLCLTGCNQASTSGAPSETELQRGNTCTTPDRYALSRPHELSRGT